MFRKLLALCMVLALGLPVMAAEVQILQPLNRTAYQTNERIDLAIVRTNDGDLTPGNLVLTLTGRHGSRMSFRFPVKGGGNRAVEHLHLNGRLLRPGRYTLEVAVDGTKTQTVIDVYSHVRRSSFRVINWGGSNSGQNRNEKQWSQGEDNLGYNLLLGSYAPYGQGYSIRAGVDFMQCCTMSGGHQMDLRMDCDWSDPYVSRGGRRRVAARAFTDRTRSNVIGVHFYDEPGLTWWKDPATGKMTPHMIPAQVQSFRNAFGKDPLRYNKVNPDDPKHFQRWRHWARWKLGFMDATWQESQFGVSYVRDDYLSVTQSQYGGTAFADGYYFNVVRSLPIISGHGGYHDYGPGYFNPSKFLEMARARDWARPNWYLPCWYGNTTADEFRLQQYLSFQTNIQGLASPPGLDPFNPSRLAGAPGIVESNKLALRLGTIFTTMPVTRPPVAMLYSLSHLIHHQATRNIHMNYAHSEAHGANLNYTYLAGKLLQYQFMTVVDEDIVDGTLAAHHKALILTSVDYLDPKVLTALKDFVKQGGLLLLTGDCELRIKGAVNLGITPGLPAKNQKQIKRLQKQLKKAGLSKAKTEELSGKLRALGAMRAQLAGAKTLAWVLKPHLERAGIKPEFECDQPGIVATRQAAGDIEYLFAVNATHDPRGNPQLGMMATSATISIPDDGRPVYNAVLGGPAPEFKKKRSWGRGSRQGTLTGTFRFGPGAMKVFARTARPIGSVRAARPVVHRDYTLSNMPIRLDTGATLLDNQGRLLSGSAPLRLRVVDPLGVTRYDLYRATKNGVLQLSLPLAANDPAGQWTVTVRDLLAGTEDRVSFQYKPVARCGALAGAAYRAVSFGRDRKNIFRFFRLRQQLTIVPGTSAYNQAAAARLTKMLGPWNVRCEVMNLAAAAKTRKLTPKELSTWVGLDYRGTGQIPKAGDKNPPAISGFAVRGPVILLGTPEDNPLIAFLQKRSFLPYKASRANFPGPGRGYLAWQYDAIGVGQESVTLIAYDRKGMAEAVGSMFEALAGLDPLTPWQPPAAHRVAPATAAAVPPKARLAWTAALPDRVDALEAARGNLTVVTHDGSVASIDARGKVISLKVMRTAGSLTKRIRSAETKLTNALQKTYALDGRILKQVAARSEMTAVGYWGGLVRVVGADGQVRMSEQFQHDVCGLAWLGKTLAVGLSDGRVVGVRVR